MATEREPLEVLALRVPRAHAQAVREYAEHLTSTTRVRVTASAAGAAVIEAGLVALGLLPAPTAKKGAKHTARKP